MSTLTIRKLPEETKARLRERAARAGRSMEAEVREILVAIAAGEEAPPDPADLQALVDELYAGARPKGVVADLIAERRRSARDE
jgi:plasmid stability protein